MNDFIFRMPPKIEVGFSKSKDLVKILKGFKLNRVLVVVDNNLKKLGLVDHILNSLKEEKVSFDVFDGIINEPTINEVDEAIKEFRIVSNFDAIVGVGGGSTIDVSKLFAVSGNFKGTIENYIGTDLIEKPGIPMIILPTTSGTGAEATPNAIIKNVERGWKKGIVSPYLIPDLVVLDPELTLSLPKKITAETGIDAFTHAIECFIGNKANTMSDLFALEAIRLIKKYLLRAFRDGNDREARYYMLIASLYGGIAITNSGTGGVHALAYPLGGKYNISHGLSNSLLLTEVMKFNSKAVPEKFLKVAEAMGVSKKDISGEKIVKSVVEEIEDLVKGVDINIGDIEGLEISDKILDELSIMAIAEQQRLLKNNPREIKYGDAKMIYMKTLHPSH